MKVLIFLSRGTEEVEAVTAIDLFRRAGYDVIVAGTDTPIVCSRGTKIIPEVLIQNLENSTLYDLVYLPGGSEGTKNLSINPKVEYILHQHIISDKYIAAICAAPLILIEKGLIDKNTLITSHPSISGKFHSYNYSNNKFVIDGKILTSRGVGTAIEFVLAIIELLSGKEIAQKVAQDIVFSENR